MAWTSGTVTSFAGATGFMQALIDLCCGVRYDQVAGTGDGVQTTFPFTLPNTPAAKGQTRLVFKLGTTEYQVFDDGEGAWQHDKISASACDYNTGVCSVTFTEALADLYDMAATYVVGKNAGEEGRDWLLLHHRNSQDNFGADAFPGLGLKECWMKNSGVSYKEQIYIGFREYQYIAETLYGLNCNVDYEFGIPPADDAHWNFNGPKTTRTQYDAARENYFYLPSVPMADDTLAYWIGSSKNRILGVVRSGNTHYHSFYSGAGLRLASPARYPYPLTAIATAVYNQNWSHTSTSYILGPQAVAFMLWGLGGNFLVGGADRYVDPRQGNFVLSGEIARTTNELELLYPVLVREYQGTYSATMQLEGLYGILDNDIAAENTIDVGGQDHLVIPNINKGTYADYMAIEMK